VKLNEELDNPGSGLPSDVECIWCIAKNYLPHHRQNDGGVLLRNERRKVLLQADQENLRPVLLRHEVSDK
jgi:hypothetical protein